MADIAGRSGLLATSTDGVTYTAVGGMKEISFKISGKTMDVTDHDSGVYEEFMGGRLNHTLSASGNYDEADTGQEALWTAHLARTKVYFRFRPTTAGGAKNYIAQGIVTSIEDSAPNDDANQVSFEIQLSGTLTRSNQ